jgi:hypothetical protein
MKTQEYIEFKQSLVTLVKTALRSLRKNKNQLELQKYETKSQCMQKFRDLFEEKYKNILEHCTNEYVKVKFEDGKIFNANFMYEFNRLSNLNDSGKNCLVLNIPQVFGLDFEINVKGLEVIQDKSQLELVTRIIDKLHYEKCRWKGKRFQKHNPLYFESYPLNKSDYCYLGEREINVNLSIYGYDDRDGVAPIMLDKLHIFDDLPEWRYVGHVKERKCYYEIIIHGHLEEFENFDGVLKKTQYKTIKMQYRKRLTKETVYIKILND